MGISKQYFDMMCGLYVHYISMGACRKGFALYYKTLFSSSKDIINYYKNLHLLYYLILSIFWHGFDIQIILHSILYSYEFYSTYIYTNYNFELLQWCTIRSDKV